MRALSAVGDDTGQRAPVSAHRITEAEDDHTTAISPAGMTFVQAAHTLAAHLAEHQLPEPASLDVTTSYGNSTVTAQLRATTVHGIAAELLAWADTVSAVTIQSWRPPEGDRVHLSIRGTLSSPAGTVEVKVFAGVSYDPLRFADLQPDPFREVPLSLDKLRGWAACRDGSESP